MEKRFTREEIKQRFQASIDAGQPIVVASAGIGIAAKFAERGGADMIGLFNSSYLGLGRVEATSLMPYGNANDIVMSLGDRIFLSSRTPRSSAASSAATRPRNDAVPEDHAVQGFPGRHQFPLPGFAYGQHRRNLERNNYGVQQELKTLRTRKNLASTRSDWRMMRKLPCRLLRQPRCACARSAMLEWENGGATLEQAAEYINRVSTKAKAVAPEMLIFVQGLPVQTPEDTQYIYDHTDAVGFIGINNMDYGTNDSGHGRGV